MSRGIFQKTFQSRRSAASELEAYLNEPLRRLEFAKRLKIRASIADRHTRSASPTADTNSKLLT